MRLLITLLLLLPCFCFGQNLVPNPSFELYSQCPDDLSGQVDRAIGWDQYHDSPDYFHKCGVTSQVQVPRNLLGYQYPASGDAYCGFATYNEVGSDREIIGTQLQTPLTISQTYYISFQVNRADSFWISAIATNKTGVRFYTVEPATVFITNWAHFYTDTIINDTVNWVRVFGSFIADSAYQYMLIGNFFDDINTDTLHDTSYGAIAYYYIDDVCVSTDSTYCANFVGLKEHKPTKAPSIFPNPTTGVFTVTGQGPVQVFDLLGNLVLAAPTREVDLSGYPSGIYIVRVGERTQKLVLSKNP